jgi:hypothetical protein
MLIRLLTAYMALAFTAGPGLCCCATTHFAAHGRPAGENQPSRPSRPESPPCCQHHSQARHDQTASTRHNEPTSAHLDSDNPQKHPCPCREHGSAPQIDRTAAAPPVDDSSARYWLSLVSMVPSFGSGPLLPAVVSERGPGHAPPRPFLSIDDLLHVHHLLRC